MAAPTEEGPSYDPATGQLLNFFGRAIEVAEFDPAYAARVREELHAGPITPKRVWEAVRELAGVGATVEIRLQELEEVDLDGESVWFAAGWLDGRAYGFPVNSRSAVPMRELMDRGEPIRIFVPPADMIELPDGILDSGPEVPQ